MTRQHSPNDHRSWLVQTGLFLLETAAVILLVLLVGWLLVQWAAHAGPGV